MQRATDESQHAACNGRDATWDRRQAAQPMRHGTVGRASENMRHAATESVQRRHATGSVQETSATDNRRHATYGEDATDATQRATHNVQTTCAMQRAVCSKRLATRNGQRATCARLHATYSEQQTTCNATDSMQQTTGNGQRATGNGQQTTWKRQQTAWNGQHATRQQTTGNRRHAADGRHRAADSKQPATGNGQHATDNVQQIADNMPEDVSTCEMQQASRSTAVLCVRRAADGTHPAACAKHCMRQPVRNSAQTPRTRCNITIRAVPQQAAGHAMHEMRRTKCCGSPHPRDWIVGFSGRLSRHAFPKPPFEPPAGFRLGGASISPCHPRQTTRRGCLPGAALAPLAEFRLEPVEENTATRVPERARVGTGHAFAKCAPPSGRRPTDRCTLTVRVTDGRTVNTARATQRGFQDDKGFKNTFLQTSPRCTALTASPSPSSGTCASGDVVLFAAAARHQPSRSAACALKSMACGTRRCGRRVSGRAAWARY
jgi:hypothetical protein